MSDQLPAFGDGLLAALDAHATEQYAKRLAAINEYRGRLMPIMLAQLARGCRWCGKPLSEHRIGGPLARMICLGQVTGFEAEPDAEPEPKVVMATVPYAEYEAT